MKHVVLTFLLTLGVSLPAAANDYKEVYWEDLVPENYIAPESSVNHSGSSMVQVAPDAPVVEKYDGQKVKVPGFVVPLEGTADVLTEFLLVPFFGACIHVPPPPSNQIIYVKFPKGIEVGELYDAIWVSGTMSTKGWSGDIATVGYTMEGVKIEPYE